VRFFVALAFGIFLACGVIACNDVEDEMQNYGRMNVQRAAPALKQCIKEIESLRWRIPALDLAMHVHKSAEQQALAFLDVREKPSNVYYTILRGGSLKDVANNFGIYHHDITALNSGVPLNAPLNAGTRVRVYKRDEASQSHGHCWAGKLIAGVPMPEGPGRILRTNRFKSWATDYVIESLDYSLKQWAKRYPERDPIFIGNLSLRVGGDIEPHKTHEAGRSVDLGYPVVRTKTDPLQWHKPTRKNFDCEANWDLIKLLMEGGELIEILIDYEIQGYLYDCAPEVLGADASRYLTLMQYPKGPRAPRRFIRHVKGHEDHLHITYRCATHDKACKQ
jgi:hypothetical protein